MATRSAETKKHISFTKYAKTATLEEIKRLEKLLVDSPQNRELLDWLAFAYYSHSVLDKAIEYYRRLVEMCPDNAGYHYYLGNSLYKANEDGAARVEWEKVLALDRNGQFTKSVKEKIAAIDGDGS